MHCEAAGPSSFGGTHWVRQVANGRCIRKLERGRQGRAFQLPDQTCVAKQRQRTLTEAISHVGHLKRGQRYYRKKTRQLHNLEDESSVPKCFPNHRFSEFCAVLALFYESYVHIEQLRDRAQTVSHHSSKEATLRVFGDSLAP